MSSTVTQSVDCFLIEDDIDDQEIFLSALTAISPTLTCSTAFNGKEAFEKLAFGEIKPELIFLDLNMPLMNGHEFLNALKHHEKICDIPVVILSTSSDSFSVEQSLNAGAVEFITKPDRFAAWEEVIRNVLSNRLKKSAK